MASCQLVSKKYNFSVTAIDIDPKAIESSELNCKINNVEIKLFASNLFENINYDTFDLIFWNLPYYQNTDDYLTGLIDQSDKYLVKDGKLILGYNTSPLKPEAIKI